MGREERRKRLKRKGFVYPLPAGTRRYKTQGESHKFSGNRIYLKGPNVVEERCPQV
jgi:hypothetical protein